MSRAFDPYHTWLGIRPEEQPPDHYRLLGLQPFEDQPEAIDHAADQRMVHLRTFQSGQHAEASQRLLNEVAAARLCLLSPEKKAAYDRTLREKLRAAAQPEPPPVEAADAGLTQLFRHAGRDTATARPRPGGQASPRQFGLLLAGVAAVLIAVVGLILWAATRGDHADRDTAGGSHRSPSSQAAEQPEPVENPSVDAGEPPTEVQSAPLAPPAVPAQLPELEPKPEPFAEPVPQPESVATSRADFPEVAPAEPAEGAMQGEPEEPSSPEQPAKLPPPSRAEQQEIAAKIDEAYEVARAATPAEKLDLARTLSDLGRRPSVEPAERFVLLRKTAELAGSAGDAGMMLEAVDAMAETFEIDSLRAKESLLTRLAAAAGDVARIKALLDASREVIDKAVAEDRLDVALGVATAAYQTCAKGPGTPLRKAAYDRREQIEAAHAEWLARQRARALLEADPDHAAANLLLGRWLCFEREDWERGLPHLARGSDVPLRDLARQELAGPGDEPGDLLALADAWWDLAEGSEGADQDALRGRAAFWYEQAVEKLPPGVDRQKARMRLAKIAEAESAAAPAAGSSQPAPRVPKRQFLLPAAAARLFGLQPPKWSIAGNELVGMMGNVQQPINNPMLLAPYRASSLEFGLKMKARWFQRIHVDVDGKRYTYSRGELGLGTLITDDGRQIKRWGEKVAAPDGWSSLAVKLDDDTLSFSYNEQLEWSRTIPPAENGEHLIYVGFGSSGELLKPAPIGVKDVYLEHD